MAVHTVPILWPAKTQLSHCKYILHTAKVLGDVFFVYKNIFFVCNCRRFLEKFSNILFLPLLKSLWSHIFSLMKIWKSNQKYEQYHYKIIKTIVNGYI